MSEYKNSDMLIAINEGKETTIRRVAQMEHIDYKQLLYKILVEKEDPYVAINMISQMEQG